MATATKKATKAPTVKLTVGTFDQSFDSPIFRVVRSRSLKQFGEFPASDYRPDNRQAGPGGGATPLRDATMEMIHTLDEARTSKSIQIGLLLDESGSMGSNRQAVIDGLNEFVGGLSGVDASEPNRVLCVIFTDGFENASRNVTPEALKQAVSEREADGWTFIFMGANMDAWSEAHANVGISGGVSGQSVNYTSSPVGTQSAMRHATRRAGAFTQGEAVYSAMASAEGNNSVIPEDDGDVTGPWTPPEAMTPYKGVTMGDALKKARNSITK